MPRLKVLHIITHFAVGGATEPTITTCQYLDRARFEAVILSGETEPGQGTMLPQAQAAGVAVHVLPSLHRPIRPLADYRAYRDLTAWIADGKWDVVHTHGSKAGALGRLAAKKAGVPIIIHNVHGWGHHGHMSRPMRWFYIQAERRVARITDRFLTDASANIAKGLADGIGRPEQYVTVYNGIDIARFRDANVDRNALRAEFGIPPDAPVIGTIGRLAAQKAPDDFVRMASHIHAARPDAHFVWVGGGPLEADTLARIQAAGLQNAVHLLGYRSDIPALLRIFDIFTLTSLWEGLPRVFAQAMCARLPIVATHVDGAAEAITDGENGYLIAPQRPQAQADLILTLLSDPALCRKLGECGLRRADPQFNEQHMVHQISEIYLSLARQKGIPLPDALPASTFAAPETATL